MSEEAAVAVAPEAPVSSAPAGESATPEVTPSPFEGVDFEKKFGVAAEEGPAPASDVEEAPNPPVPRQDTEVTKDEAETPTDETEKPTPDVIDEDSVGLKRLRGEYKELKGKYLALTESDLESQFVTSPADHLKWMEETSPQSFAEVAQQVANRAASENPEGWIDYFVKQNPDLVAAALLGKEKGYTLDQLKAELSTLTPDDDEDVQANLEKIESKKTTVETPEQKEIREWREERAKQKEQQQQQEVKAITDKWMSPIASAIDECVSEAGLGIEESTLAKPYDSLSDDEKYAVLVNTVLIPQWINTRIGQDPKLLNMQNRVSELLAKGDEQGAMKLQHHAKIAATNFATEALSLITAKRAAAIKSETQSPTTEKPPPQVRSNGNANGAIPDDGEIDFKKTAEQYFARG